MSTKPFAGAARCFYSMSLAYYARDDDRANPCVMIGMYGSDGGCFGEFAVRWHRLGTALRDPSMEQSSPRLEVFDDAWAALAHFRDLLDWLALQGDRRLTHDELVAQLKAMGIQDRTAYTRE